MPGSVLSLYVEDANELGSDVSSEAEGRPPDHTGSIQASETAMRLPFASHLKNIRPAPDRDLSDQITTGFTTGRTIKCAITDFRYELHAHRRRHRIQARLRPLDG